MKLINLISPSVLILIFLINIESIESSRLLLVILPERKEFDQQPVYVPQRQIRRSNRGGRSNRSLNDHLFYMDRRSIQNCAIAEEDENTFLSMDRLCEACHEMYRHTEPNLRANCRSNCFDNDDFVFCFNHFTGVEVTRGKR